MNLTNADVESLKQQLLLAVQTRDARATRRNKYGQLYEVEFSLPGATGLAVVVSVWIMRDDEGFPRLVTCYPV